MPYPPRRASNPNRVTLDLDPLTSERLTAEAKARKIGRDRLAYEFLMTGLGIVTTALISPPAITSEDDPMGELISRVTTSNHPPKEKP